MALGLSLISGTQINDTENALRTGNTLLNGIIDISESFDRLVKH